MDRESEIKANLELPEIQAMAELKAELEGELAHIHDLPKEASMIYILSCGGILGKLNRKFTVNRNHLISTQRIVQYSIIFKVITASTVSRNTTMNAPNALFTAVIILADDAFCAFLSLAPAQHADRHSHLRR